MPFFIVILDSQFSPKHTLLAVGILVFVNSVMFDNSRTMNEKLTTNQSPRLIEIVNRSRYEWHSAATCNQRNKIRNVFMKMNATRNSIHRRLNVLQSKQQIFGRHQRNNNVLTDLENPRWHRHFLKLVFFQFFTKKFRIGENKKGKKLNKKNKK